MRSRKLEKKWKKIKDLSEIYNEYGSGYAISTIIGRMLKKLGVMSEIDRTKGIVNIMLARNFPTRLPMAFLRE